MRSVGSLIKGGEPLITRPGVWYPRQVQRIAHVWNDGGHRPSSTFHLPSTLLPGDIVMAMSIKDSSPGPSVSGYTDIYNQVASGGPASYAGYKIMGDTPDTTVVFTGTGEIAVRVYRGVDPANPIDNGVSSATGASGSPNPPSHTTVTTNALRIIMGFLDDDIEEDATTPPAGGWTSFSCHESRYDDGATFMIADLLAPTPGAVDPDAFNSTSDEWHSIHFALRPLVP